MFAFMILDMMTSCNRHSGTRQKRQALALLTLACLIMLVCLTQRISSLHASPGKAVSPSAAFQPYEAGLHTGLSPCQLEAHSVFMAQPVLFDGALPALEIILSIILLTGSVSLCSRPRASPPSALTRRIHLKNCVFRL